MDDRQENVTTSKAGLSKEIWERIHSVLKERHITQVELQKMCAKRGYQVGQPEISKLSTGRAQLTLYQLIAFSEALEIPPERLIRGRENFHMFHVEGSAFTQKPSDSAFDAYMGAYYTVMHSTAPSEDEFLHGTLVFRPSANGNICEAVFELDTGVKNKQGAAIMKQYQGQLLISEKMSTAYCLLANETIGELCLLEFRHRRLFAREVECRLGLVLTVAAGEKKVPVTHRIFLSRAPIDEEMEHRCKPFLKQESKEVLIRKEDLEKFLEKQDIPYLDSSELMQERNMGKFLVADSNLIRKLNRRLSRSEIAEIFCAMKTISTGQFSFRLDEEDDTFTYELISRTEMPDQSDG